MTACFSSIEVRASQTGATQPGMIQPQLTNVCLTNGGLVALADNITMTATPPARWYAVYTRANHEKRVANQCVSRCVEHFLPRYESVRRWKDRRVTLKLPLFPGYLFVRLAPRDRLSVLQIPSVVRVVGFNGVPAPLPDEEVEILRSGLAQCEGVQPHPFLTVGRRVRITKGPFAGLDGVLKRRKSNLRVVVSLNLIQRSVAVDVDGTDVRADA